MLDGVDTSVKKTATTVETEGARIESRTAKLAGAFRQNFASIAATTAGLGAGIISFATSFDILDKAQTKADQANLTYEKSLRRLEEMQKDTKTSSRELAEQQEKVRINADKAAQAQDALGDTYTNFLAQIPSQMISFGTSAVGIFSLLRTTQIANSAASVTSAATYNGALASMNVSTAASTSAMGAFRIASIAAFMTNPVTLAIMGISVVVMLLVTHFDELTAGITWLGGVISEFISGAAKALLGVLDFLTGGVFHLNNAFAQEMPKATDTAGQALDSLGTKTNEVQADAANFRAELMANKKVLDEDWPGAINTTKASLQALEDRTKVVGDNLHIYFGKIQTDVRAVNDDFTTTIKIVDEVIAKVTRAAALPLSADALGISDSISASAIRPSIGANVTRAGGALGTPASNTSYLNGISGTTSKKKAARGMNEILAQDTVIYAHKGEHASIRPGVSGTNGGSSGDVVHIHLELNGREIAVASIADIKDLLAKDARVEAKARKAGIYGSG